MAIQDTYTHRLLGMEQCEESYAVTYAGTRLALWDSITQAVEQLKILTRHPEWIRDWLPSGSNGFDPSLETAQ